MEVSQVIHNGTNFLQSKRTMVLGFSPGNPHYYKMDVLKKLFHFGKTNSDKLMLFIPEKISEHNHKAVGSLNPGRSAKTKAKPLRKKCNNVLQSSDHNDTSYSFVRWEEEVETCPKYHEALQEITSLYETNEEFREDIKKSTESVLRCLAAHRQKGKVEEDVDSTDSRLDVEEGVKYPLKELAFFVAIPSAYEGCEEYALVYHRSWPVVEKFFGGHYDGVTRPYFGFVVFE